MLYALLAAVLVAVDQVVKYLVRTHIPLGTSLPFLPGLVELTYVKNTGAAFSIFSDHTWVLTLISAVVAAAIAQHDIRGRQQFRAAAFPVVTPHGPVGGTPAARITERGEHGNNQGRTEDSVNDSGHCSRMDFFFIKIPL